VFAAHRRFRTAKGSRLTLPASLAAEVRAAQVSGIPEFHSVRSFRREGWGELPAFLPRILVGYAFDLDRLVAQVESGTIALPSVDRAIFVLTDCGSLPVGEPFRERLWSVFGVPLYELIIAPGCRLLAAECERHDGWHLQANTEVHLANGELMFDVPPLASVHTGFTADLDPAPCDCGRVTHRLKNLYPLLPKLLSRRAAVGSAPLVSQPR
jgi:hypothetical protein